MVKLDEARLKNKLQELLRKKEFAAKSYTSGSYKQSFKREARKIEEIIPGLLSLTQNEIQTVLKHGEKIAEIDPDLGFFYFLSAPGAIKHFREKFPAWVEKGTSLNLEDAKRYFKSITREVIEEIGSKGLELEKVKRVLTLYIQSISGQPIKLKTGEISTDARTIFLPERISIFPSDDENFKVYKLMVMQGYGLIKYGSFDLHLEKIHELINRIGIEYGTNPTGSSGFEIFFSLFPDPELAIDIYSYLENRRIEYELKNEFRGLARDIENLRISLGLREEKPMEKSPEDSAKATFGLYREKKSFEFPLFWTKISLNKSAPEKKSLMREYKGIGFKTLDGRNFSGEITTPETNVQVQMREKDKRGAYIYDEWDYKLNKYRPCWCALREKKVKKGSPRFVERCLEKYSAYVYIVKRQFEMLRTEDKKMKKQIDGEEIDIDAIVEGYADMKAGGRACEKLYTRLDKRERNVATAFLVDLSGSTTGWVIETEKEALVVLCEGLEKLGDKYAIYGFSGKTRRQCDFYVFKEFDEPYDEEIKARIAGMDAFDYTRMGPPIRHLTQKLRMVEARVKIMIILSDGKPEDFDEYKGKHGIEDTRKALVEAKQAGIKPFCITIDKEARGYIQRLFGDVGYVILNDIGKLPRRLPDIYKRLST